MGTLRKGWLVAEHSGFRGKSCLICTRPIKKTDLVHLNYFSAATPTPVLIHVECMQNTLDQVPPDHESTQETYEYIRSQIEKGEDLLRVQPACCQLHPVVAA